MTIEQWATRYVQCIRTKPNAWGQFHEKGTGWSSCQIMQQMVKLFGFDETQAAIKIALKQ